MNSQNYFSKTVWRNPIHFFACGFGSGLLPKAPGTYGTLAAIPFYFLLAEFSTLTYVIVLLATFGVGVWLCDIAVKDSGVQDHPSIVWDEMVGYWLTMFLVPVGLIWAFLGFCLFRLFDIWKPWPINLVNDKIKGGFGVMLDDILAAVYAWIVLQIFALIIM